MEKRKKLNRERHKCKIGESCGNKGKVEFKI